MDKPGLSTFGSHPRETHWCSWCCKLGHYGRNCPALEVTQQPAKELEPSPILSRPTATRPQGQTLASDRPRGPHMGEVGWDDDKWEHSTEDMSDAEEVPSRSHEDQLDRAGIWQDSSSPPRRLVFSPSATQVSCPRPSILTRLGDPPEITNRLSVVMDKLPPVSTPTPKRLVTRPPIQGTTSIMKLDQQLLDVVYNESDFERAGNKVSIVDNCYDSDPYESNSDNLDGKDHEVDQRQSMVSNAANTYGTMVLLNDVAFDMPVNPHVAKEIVLTHALYNPGDVQEPTVKPTATVPMEPEQEEPTAEPAAPVFPESPVLNPNPRSPRC
jgi:hypothetical protein